MTPGFVEIGDRVLVARYRAWDVNVGLVLGRRGALVIDTRGGVRQAAEIAADLERLHRGLRAAYVVNTHVHFDHALGNSGFPQARVLAHEQVHDRLAAATEAVRAELGADPGDCPEWGYTAADALDVLETPLRGPDVAVGSWACLDLGERVVELRHEGRGHTDSDLAIAVPDAGVCFLGDLVEESGPPSVGPDSHLAEWPGTLDRLLAHLPVDAVVVPGHGTPVDREFVVAQRDALAALAAG